MAYIVSHHAEQDDSMRGTLFNGIKFFIALRVPSRSDYIEKVISNGGEVVKLQQHATVLIADHLKAKDAAPGSISYRYIDQALRSGELPNHEDDEFRCGPVKGEARPVGSSASTRNMRTPFSAEDDNVLRKWVEQHAIMGGANGNAIYQQLEAVNGRHTWQSWRDRWVKRLSHQRDTASNPSSSHPASELPALEPRSSARTNLHTPATAPIPRNEDSSEHGEHAAHEIQNADAIYSQGDRSSKEPDIAFTAEDCLNLMFHTKKVNGTPEARRLESFAGWADINRDGTVANSEQWYGFWKRTVAPLHRDIFQAQYMERATPQDRLDDRKRKEIYCSYDMSWLKANRDAPVERWIQFYKQTVRPLLFAVSKSSQLSDMTLVSEGSREISSDFDEAFKSSARYTQADVFENKKRPREDEIASNEPSPAALNKRSRLTYETGTNGSDDVFETAAEQPDQITSHSHASQSSTDGMAEQNSVEHASDGQTHNPEDAFNETLTWKDASIEPSQQANSQDLYAHILPQAEGEQDGEESEEDEDVEDEEVFSTPVSVRARVASPQVSPTTASRALKAAQQIALDTQAIMDAEDEDEGEDEGEDEELDFTLAAPEGGFDDEETEAGEKGQVQSMRNGEGGRMDEESEEQVTQVQSPRIGDDSGSLEQAIDDAYAEESDPLGKDLAAQALTSSMRSSHTSRPNTPNREPHHQNPTHYKDSHRDTHSRHTLPYPNTQARAVEEKRLLLERMDAIDFSGQVKRARNEQHRRHMLLALRATSANPNLFKLALDHLEAGRGLPYNVPGVWSAEDDEALRSADPRRIEALDRRHGWYGPTGFLARGVFLDELNNSA